MRSRLPRISLLGAAALAVAALAVPFAVREGIERAPRCDAPSAPLSLGLEAKELGWLSLAGAGALLAGAAGGGALPFALDPALREHARQALDALHALRASSLGAPIADHLAAQFGELIRDWPAITNCLSTETRWT